MQIWWATDLIHSFFNKREISDVKSSKIDVIDAWIIQQIHYSTGCSAVQHTHTHRNLLILFIQFGAWKPFTGDKTKEERIFIIFSPAAKVRWDLTQTNVRVMNKEGAGRRPVCVSSMKIRVIFLALLGLPLLWRLWTVANVRAAAGSRHQRIQLKNE